MAGCNRSGSAYQPTPPKKTEMIAVKEGPDQNLVPLKEGNQWTFSGQMAASVGGKSQSFPGIEQTFKIAKVETTARGTEATIEITVNGKVNSRQVWLANDKGLFQVSATPALASADAPVPDLKALSTPQPIIEFPASMGKKFTWSGTGPMPNSQIGTNTVESTILGPQDVDTDEGTMTAIAVDSETTFTAGKDQGKSKSTIWLAPGIGIARYTQEALSGTTRTKLVLKLKSHSLKN